MYHRFAMPFHSRKLIYVNLYFLRWWLLQKKSQSWESELHLEDLEQENPWKDTRKFLWHRFIFLSKISNRLCVVLDVRYWMCFTSTFLICALSTKSHLGLFSLSIPLKPRPALLLAASAIKKKGEEQFFLFFFYLFFFFTI
mgnify:CR=1 FL=1